MRGLAVLAALLGGTAALAGTASAQEMRVTSTGENFDVEWSGPRDNLVGGANARMMGGGEDAQVVTMAPPVPVRRGMLATMSGGGEDTTVTRMPAPAESSSVAVAGATAAPARSAGTAGTARR